MNIKTALALIAGAVFFFMCANSAASPGDSDTQLMAVTTDAAYSDSNAAAGNLVVLGSYNYAITLPDGYSMAFDENDSIFRIVPDVQDTGCGQHLQIEFSKKPLTVAGFRPMRFMNFTVLNQSVKFQEWKPFGWTCHDRRGAVKLSDGEIHIICDAPEGEKMEHLFAIALTLQEVTDTMTTH